MKNAITTERLTLNGLTAEHGNFILELVNTPGWLRFIGDRNVHDLTGAEAYIQKILGMPNIDYHVVCLRETGSPIGVISYIQRDYLDHPDIGFAFLPAFMGSGYAFEAAKGVLHHLRQNTGLDVILATTRPDNISSITLLNKLGLTFEKTISVENETLQVYKSVF